MTWIINEDCRKFLLFHWKLMTLLLLLDVIKFDFLLDEARTAENRLIHKSRLEYQIADETN